MSGRDRLWPGDAVLALVLAATVGALSVSGSTGLQMPAGERVVMLCAVAGLHLSVIGRRRWPQAAFVLVSVAMLVLLALPDSRSAVNGSAALAPVPLLLLPSTLLYALLLTSVTASTRRRVGLAALTSGLLGVLLAGVRLRDFAAQVLPSSPWGIVVVTLVLAVVVVAAWLIGLLLASRADALRTERTYALDRARAAERTAIAAEMHDIVAHSLAVIVRQAEAGSYVAASTPEKAVAALDVVAETGRTALNEMRGMLSVLRADGQPSTGDTLTDRSVAALVDNARSTGLMVDVVTDGESYALERPVEVAGYRVLRESLTNCVKHAGAGSHVQVTLRWRPQALDLEIVDDGAGEPKVPAPPGAGVGLVGLTERVAAVRGTLSSGPVEPLGFAVRARLPRTVTER